MTCVVITELSPTRCTCRTQLAPDANKNDFVYCEFRFANAI